MTQSISNQSTVAPHRNIISSDIGLKESAFAPDVLKSGFVASLNLPPLGAKLEPLLISSILEAWKRFPVLVFPKQSLNPTELARFTQQLGSFGYDPYVKSIDQHSNVIEVRREATETTPIFGQSWHSDWSFQPIPPSGTLLQSKVIPPVGGDTVFANMYMAYESLSPAMQTLLQPLKGIHTAGPAYGPRGLFSKDDESRSMKIVVSDTAEQRCAHPIVRTHPASGRKCLYINHVYTVGIEGFKEAESSTLLNFLFRHMSQHSFTYRHKWAEHMLVLWDNRCVIHFADGGYDGHQRILYRTTMAGEKPYLDVSSDPTV